jgi:hypothetical protein
MSLDLSLIKGYVPSMEEILKDMKIRSEKQFVPTLLKKCEKLYFIAKKNNLVDKLDTRYDFIICKSNDFYKTFVDMGYGNAALNIFNDNFPFQRYFLIFSDKLPKKFYKIVAAHEACEYEDMTIEGISQQKAHLHACKVEIDVSKKLGLKKDYLDYLKNNYFMKYNALKKQKII